MAEDLGGIAEYIDYLRAADEQVSGPAAEPPAGNAVDGISEYIDYLNLASDHVSGLPPEPPADGILDYVDYLRQADEYLSNFPPESTEFLWGGPLADFLKESKMELFTVVGEGEPRDLRLVLSPSTAAPIDSVCSAIGASYDLLLAMRQAGRASPLAVPILNSQRGDFVGSPLEKWLASHGLSDQVLLFVDDADSLIREVQRCVASDDAAGPVITGGGPDAPQPVWPFSSPTPSRARVAKVALAFKKPPAPARGNAPGACGCHTSVVADRLLQRTSALLPASRGRLFATGPAAEDPMLLCVLRLLRLGVLASTRGLDPRWKGRPGGWCEADADVVGAIDALLRSGA